MTRPARSAVWLLVSTVALAGCAGGSRFRPRAAPDEVVFGVYRGQVTPPEGRRIPFRAWVWAGAPDRLHVEILPPVGGPAWIVDAGGGLLAVTDVASATCWIGTETPGSMERWLGVATDVPGLVSSLLDDGDALPATVELVGDRLGRLRMERTGFRVAPRGSLGTATPPPGVDTRPLAEIEGSAFPSAEEGRAP